jgi:hypothetical protein
MSKLNEDPSERARSYIANFEKTLQQLILMKGDSKVKAQNIRRVSDTIQRYLQDAHYYLENGKPTTSLASIAYAEGLLDALTFLQLTAPNPKAHQSPFDSTFRAETSLRQR